MMLTGRLSATVDGRPVEFAAAGSGLTLEIPSLSTAWSLRRAAVHPGMRTALMMLASCGLSLRVRVAGLVSLEIAPNPGPLARILLGGSGRAGR